MAASDRVFCLTNGVGDSGPSLGERGQTGALETSSATAEWNDFGGVGLVGQKGLISEWKKRKTKSEKKWISFFGIPTRGHK